MMCNKIVIGGGVTTWKLNVTHIAQKTVSTHEKSVVWNQKGFS